MNNKNPEKMDETKPDEAVQDPTVRACYREWSPMVKLLSQIPTRIHRNIVGYDLNLTCIAAHSHYLALGTNAGLVYWYNRQTGELNRLWCSDRKTAISRVAVVETVDFMVAAGNVEGQLTIFQIPRPVDTNIPRFVAVPSSLSDGKEAEYFTIQGAHKCTVTAIAWAVNGMRLFSGDKSGQVFMTEIDFITRTTSTSLIAEEKGEEIVQLSYLKQVLLISSTERACVCLTSQNCQIIPIGSQPRKSKGHFGGVVFSSVMSKSGGILVCRPKKTLYDVNAVDGKVKATILLKTLIAKSHCDIPLVNPSIFHNANEDDEIWRILQLEDSSDSSSGTFVVYSSNIFHIVRPYVPEVVASCSGLRSLHGLAIAGEEIFVLEGPRSVIRVATFEDRFKLDDKSELDPSTNPLGDERTEGTGLESMTNLMSVDMLVGKIPNLTGNTLANIGGKFGQFFRRTSITPPEEPGARCTSPAEEAIIVDESSPNEETVKKDLSLVEHRSPTATKSKPKKVRKQKKNTASALEDKNPDQASLSSLSSSVVSQEDDFLYNDTQDGMGTLLNLRLEFQQNEDETEQESVKDTQPEADLVKIGTPEEKEARLLKALSLEKYMPASFLPIKLVSTFSGKTTEANPPVAPEKPEESSAENRTSDLPYGPPSDSSTSTLAQPVSLDISEHPSIQNIFMEVKGRPVDGWTQFETPSALEHGVTIISGQIFFCNHRGEVYVSALDAEDPNTLKWEKISYSADKIVFSPNCDLIWRLSSLCAWSAKAATLKCGEENWTMIQHQVQDISLTSTSGWILGLDGSVYIQTQLSPAKPFALESKKVDCDFNAKRIVASDRVVLALNDEGNLFARVGLSPSCPEGSDWNEVEGSPRGIVSLRLIQNPLDENQIRIVARSSQGTIFMASGSINELCSGENEEFPWFELDLYLSTGLSDIDISLGQGFFCLASTKKPLLYWKSDHVTGMIWKKLKLKGYSRVKEINASGIYKYQGLMWMLMFSDKPGCSLVYTAFHDASLHKVVQPWKDRIAAFATAPEALWVLTNIGQIYIRTEMNRLPEGANWKQLNMAQLSKDNVKLVDLSLSSDAVWAVDDKGTVWMRLGPLTPPTGDCVPVWIPVDGGATPRGSETINSKIFFTRVYSSASGRIVWALDNEQNVYVREGIFPDFRQGLDWLLVSGMTAIALSVSDVTVWALSAAGQIYKRIGITENNYIGEAWKRITSMKGSSFSATICDSLYVLDMEGEINELVTKDFQISDQVESSDEESIEHTEDGEWALVSEM